ncbi:MAG: SDR family NAD(P)-dependent oxidoreductase, partial [Acidobacteriota bacterium]
MNLKGCVSLVTGGGKRLGAAIGRSLAKQGSDIAIHFRSSPREAEQTSKELARFGVRCECFKADLTRPEEIEGLFSAVAQSFGRLDVLVNSAASFEKAAIEDIDAAAWDAVHAVNLRAPFLCTRAAAELIRASTRRDNAPGLIVNIADLSGLLAWPYYSHHGSSKAALLQLTALTARELSPQIRVNAIVPGPILPPPGMTRESREWLELCK